MEPSPFANDADSGGECGVVTNTIFPESIQWRALVHGAVTVLMLNSELSVAQGSPQWNFTRDALAAVDRAVTPWVVVAFHRPLYLVSRSASPTGPAGVRDPNFAPLEPLFVEGGVDAVLVGHVHNALVTCPVNNSVCGAGPVHVCIGNAGQERAWQGGKGFRAARQILATCARAARVALHSSSSLCAAHCHPPPPPFLFPPPSLSLFFFPLFRLPQSRRFRPTMCPSGCCSSAPRTATPPWRQMPRT